MAKTGGFSIEVDIGDVADVPKMVTEKVRKAVQDTCEGLGDEIVTELEAVVSGWKTPVKFESKLVSSQGGFSFEISTDSEVFVYVDKGTRPHTITAKNGARLAFPMPAGAPKTSPGSLKSSPSSQTAGPIIRPMTVNHPGTEARDFTGQILKKIEGELPGKLEQAISDALE